jgi:LysM repeat protein
VEVETRPPVDPSVAPICRQRFRLSKLEILIGSLILIGFLYLAYLVATRDPGDTRKLSDRIKILETKAAQQGDLLEKDLQGIKPTLQKMEERLKTMENQQKQLDNQIKQLQARPAAPPASAAEERKPAAAPAGREKILHKVKRGENIQNLARKYKVSVQELVQWNKLQPNTVLKIGDSLIIYRR